MAISVPNTLSELHQMSLSLGIEQYIQGSKKDGSRSKEDYIIPIREKILSDRFGASIPDYYNWLLQLKSPMLSKRIDEIKPELQEEIWESEGWSLEEKIAGVRCFLIKDSSGFHIFSRDSDKKDLLPIDMTGHIFIESFDISKMGTICFILDCEISSDCPDICNMIRRYGIITDTPDEALSILLINLHPILSKRIQSENNFKLVFNVFDCLYVNSTWIMNETLRKRREVVDGVLKSIEGCGLPLRQVQYHTTLKKWFYSTCLSQGYEGCIAKRLDGVYIADTTRKRDGWIKIKRVVERDAEGNVKSQIGDTIDAFITGFTPGEKGTICERYIFSLEVSVYVDSQIRVLKNIRNISAKLRGDMTELIEGIPTLKPIYYNKVVELDASGSTLLKMRHDKNPDGCKMSSELYDNLIEK